MFGDQAARHYGRTTDISVAILMLPPRKPKPIPFSVNCITTSSLPDVRASGGCATRAVALGIPLDVNYAWKYGGYYDNDVWHGSLLRRCCDGGGLEVRVIDGGRRV